MRRFIHTHSTPLMIMYTFHWWIAIRIFLSSLLILQLLPELLLPRSQFPTTTTAWTITSSTKLRTAKSVGQSSSSTKFYTTRRTLLRHNMVTSNTDKKVAVSELSTSQASLSSSSTSKFVKSLPKLPLPPPICSNVVGTWAYDTMSRRICQEILCNIVLKDCADDLARTSFLSIRDNIIQLRTELQFSSTTPITLIVPSLVATSNTSMDSQKQQEHVDECNEWNAILQPYVSKNDTWLSAPWMITEFYMYRRLMQCFDYWNIESVGYMYDPFIIQKRNGLFSSTGNAEPALQKLHNFIQQLLSTSQPSGDNSTTTTTAMDTVLRAGISFATQLSLWGNKMDLSLWPADVNMGNTDVFTAILDQASTNLLHDDSTVLNDYCITLLRQSSSNDNKFSDKKKVNIDIVVDNAGFELVTDLALAQYLIESDIAQTITFQMKSHPTFVSDALGKDLIETIEYYEQLDPIQYPACAHAGQQWRKYITNGQWQYVEDRFWVQPLAMWDMYPRLYNEFQSRPCALLFVKGDANYRRLLGDRKWEWNDSFDDVVGCYVPVPVCALRTLKAEIGCGMDATQTQRASSLDPNNWMTNGRFGVIHFGGGRQAARHKIRCVGYSVESNVP